MKKYVSHMVRSLTIEIKKNCNKNTLNKELDMIFCGEFVLAYREKIERKYSLTQLYTDVRRVRKAIVIFLLLKRKNRKTNMHWSSTYG